MSESDHRAADNAALDKQRPESCPHCGHRGSFDSRGTFLQTGQLRRVDDVRELVEHWSRYRCGDCGRAFATCEEQLVGEKDDTTEDDT